MYYCTVHIFVYRTQIIFVGIYCAMCIAYVAGYGNVLKLMDPRVQSKRNSLNYFHPIAFGLTLLTQLAFSVTVYLCIEQILQFDVFFAHTETF